MKEGKLKTAKKETVIVTTPLKKVTLANTKDKVIYSRRRVVLSCIIALCVCVCVCLRCLS